MGHRRGDGAAAQTEAGDEAAPDAARGVMALDHGSMG
jgi:hypothetical protein